MVETIIFYHPEYGPPDPETGERRRLWREHIKTPDDIWRAISATATIPGSTAAPRLQPIAARIVMLQSGVRAPMAVKVRGQDLAEIEAAARAIEALLKGVEGCEPRRPGRSHRRQALPGDPSWTATPLPGTAWS
ncbi:MAG: hypothetical protein R3F60_19675 [bacterium]